MQYEVIDNFINDFDFEIIKNEMTRDSSFPWYYSPAKVSPDQAEQVDYTFQFIHMFYENYGSVSNYTNLISPIIDKLNPLSILKIKANLTTLAPEKFDFGWHTDYSEEESEIFFKYGRTAVFYLNNNNGPTAFDLDGERVEIEAKENRLVTFEPGTTHTGCSATDAKARVVLNINYIPS